MNTCQSYWSNNTEQCSLNLRIKRKRVLECDNSKSLLPDPYIVNLVSPAKLPYLGSKSVTAAPESNNHKILLILFNFGGKENSTGPIACLGGFFVS